MAEISIDIIEHEDLVSVTVDETEDVITINVIDTSLTDPVIITDGEETHNALPGSEYICQIGVTPAIVIDNGVEHDVMPGNEYTCEYGPAADGEVHNSDASISLPVASGGSVEFPDGELTEFDGTKTALIAGKDISAKVPDNTIITNSEHTELLNLSPGQSRELNDITITNPITGATYPYPAAKNLTESLGKKIKLVYKATYDDTQDYDITAEEAGTYTGATLVNCTAVYKINDVVSSMPLTFVNTNKYTATITRTNAALDASVTITT